MSIVLLRIDHPLEPSLTERFLIDCSARQESLLRRANRKAASRDKMALFFTILCYLQPRDEMLSARKAVMQQALAELKLSIQDNQDPAVKLLNANLSGIASIINVFLTSPYGMIKVIRSPLSVLDLTSPDHRVTNVVIINDLESSILLALKKED